MRRLHRPPLSEGTQSTLAERTADVAASEDPCARARAMWGNQRNAAFQEIRASLEGMASGRARCMYCEDGHGTDIDHFRPIALYPAHAFVWSNYLLACSHCNSNLKRDRFPVQEETGEPLLIDPTVDEPTEHLLFLPSNGEFAACGWKGEASIEVFGLNDHEAARALPKGRQEAFLVLRRLLREYDREADASEAALIRRVMVDFPFSAVFAWLVAIADGPNGDRVLSVEIADLVRRHDLRSWRAA